MPNFLPSSFLRRKFTLEQQVSELAFWQSLSDHWTLEWLVPEARWTDSGRDPRGSLDAGRSFFPATSASVQRSRGSDESVRKSFKTSFGSRLEQLPGHNRAYPVCTTNRAIVRWGWMYRKEIYDMNQFPGWSLIESKLINRPCVSNFSEAACRRNSLNYHRFN